MIFRLKENIIVREVDDKIIFYDSEKMISSWWPPHSSATGRHISLPSMGT